MTKTSSFDMHHERYEAWFVEHSAAYVSELLALRSLLPVEGRGLEIGVGTGRFAAPLGLQVGVEPSAAMRTLALARGIEVVEGVAEDLPFADGTFDHVLIVTTICFVDSPARMLAETRRVLRGGGLVVVGFIDRESDMGRHYEAHKEESVFYRQATFFSAGEVRVLLEEAGFCVSAWVQTLAHPLAETHNIEPARAGCGRCAFVAVSAVRSG